MQKLLHIEVKSEAKAEAPSSPVETNVGNQRGSLKTHQDYARSRGRKLGVVLEYFRRIDTDGSNEISIKEFSEFFSSNTLVKMIEKQLSTSFATPKNLSADDCAVSKQLFAFIDADHSGLVSYQELSTCVGYSEAHKIIKKMDSDGNKYIDLGEFLEAIDGQLAKFDSKERSKQLGKLCNTVLEKSKKNKRRCARRAASGIFAKPTTQPESKLKVKVNVAAQPSVVVKTDLIEKYVELYKGKSTSVLGNLSMGTLAE
jgi:Ca2+-binding EF-hand superfamily protein